MKKLILLLLLSFTGITAFSQPVDEKYRREFDKFIENTAAMSMFHTMMDQLVSELEGDDPETALLVKEMVPGVEKIFWDFVYRELLPSYRTYVDYKDLKKINKFYSSPAGKRLAEAQPQIMLETLAKIEPLMQEIQVYVYSYLIPGYMELN